MFFYLIDLQCITDKLDSLITNTVTFKIECYECLWTVGLLKSSSIEREIVVRDWFSTHQRGTENRYCWFCFLQETMSSVSGRNKQMNLMQEQRRSSPTCPTIKASLRYWTPSSPISLLPSCNVVTVYQEWRKHDMLDGERSDLTLLIFNASLRCWAPFLSISLFERWSVVSACWDWWWE